MAAKAEEFQNRAADSARLGEDDPVSAGNVIRLNHSHVSKHRTVARCVGHKTILHLKNLLVHLPVQEVSRAPRHDHVVTTCATNLLAVNRDVLEFDDRLPDSLGANQGVLGNNRAVREGSASKNLAGSVDKRLMDFALLSIQSKLNKLVRDLLKE